MKKMRNLKGILSLLMVLVMLFSMTGCSLINGQDGKKEDANNTSATEDNVNDDQNSAANQESEASKEESSNKNESSESSETSESSESSESSKPEESSKSEESSVPELSGKYTGTFTSDTGTDLNLIVKWAAESNNNGTYTVSLQFFLESYTLDVGDRDDNTLKVKTSSGETTYYFHTDEVEREDEDFGETYIGKASFDLTETELISGAEVTVSWMFRGSYSKKELETIEATGTIKAN